MQAKNTTRLLKAEDIRGLGSKVAFNFEDVRRSCDEYVEQIRQQTREMIETARAETENVRQNAHSEGFAAGHKEGLRQAERQIAQLTERAALDMLKTSLAAMQAGAESLLEDRGRWIAAWESAAIRLSVSIAQKLIRRELNLRPELATEMIAAALELAAGNPQIRVKLHPDDLAHLGAGAAEVVRTLAACGEATLVPDASLSPGGCLVETRHGIIDARLETQLDRIVSELVGDEG